MINHGRNHTVIIKYCTSLKDRFQELKSKTKLFNNWESNNNSSWLNSNLPSISTRLLSKELELYWKPKRKFKNKI